MNKLPILDLSVIAIYMAAMILMGIYFSRKNKSSEHFTKASGKIPSWAIGLSLYATFLSSNTFIGVPGKAFASNWNSFVLSLSLPFAAFVASRLFVPFYRNVGGISAYTHLEQRFGIWARTYAVACFLLTQVARMGSIFFGIALTLQALTGYDLSTIMIVMGVCIIVYTVMGGMEAVIWTEVAQAVIITVGALIIIYVLVADMPGGISAIIESGQRENKFSLGSFSPDLTQSTFWVVFFYGFFINLNNFGMDQNYVQRYHAAASAEQAASSVWLCAWSYLLVSLLFFIIGSCLYVYYQAYPELNEAVKYQYVMERLPASATASEINHMLSSITPSDYGDKVMPHFLVNKVPAGLVGVIISALLSASMSTISSGMNASATIFSVDIYKRYFKPHITDKQNLFVLHAGTVVFGLIGLFTGLAFIGVKSLLDIWWQLAGIFAGGVLGLFLLGIISRATKNAEALTATIIGVLVIIWMTLSNAFPEKYHYLRSPFHTNMVIVIGTLTIFFTGLLFTMTKRKLKVNPAT
jgi:solute:Na+ symporter, SSS family